MYSVETGIGYEQCANSCLNGEPCSYGGNTCKCNDNDGGVAAQAVLSAGNADGSCANSAGREGTLYTPGDESQPTVCFDAVAGTPVFVEERTAMGGWQRTEYTAVALGEGALSPTSFFNRDCVCGG